MAPAAAPADTCVSPVLTVEELVDDEQFAARGAVVEARLPGAGDRGAPGRVPPGGPGAGRHGRAGGAGRGR